VATSTAPPRTPRMSPIKDPGSRRRSRSCGHSARSDSARPMAECDPHILGCLPSTANQPDDVRHTRPFAGVAARQNARRGPSRPPIPPQGATGAAYPRRRRLGARATTRQTCIAHNGASVTEPITTTCITQSVQPLERPAMVSPQPCADLGLDGFLLARTQSGALNAPNGTRTHVRLPLA
jgi:hypothetical protein